MTRFNSIVIAPSPGGDECLPHYPDKGCELAPRCLECHLPRCRFDKVDGKQWRRRPKGIPNRRNKERGARNEKGSGSRVKGQGCLG